MRCFMQETLPTAAPATGGWGVDFLKQNAAAQASASAAAQKEIEEKHAGKAANAMPSFGKAFAVPGQGAEKSVPGKAEPVCHFQLDLAENSKSFRMQQQPPKLRLPACGTISFQYEFCHQVLCKAAIYGDQ